MIQSRERAAAWTLVVTALLAPRAASAHLAATGLGPVSDGAYHAVLTPRQMLPMAMLALYAGLRGPAHARLVCAILPLAWLAATLAGPAVLGAGWVESQANFIGAVAVLVSGALLASAPPLPAGATACGAGVIGVALGCCYDAPPGLGAAAGGLAVVVVMLPLLASVALPLRRLQAIVAVRVAGSWTAALGLLLIGWWVHGRGQ